MERTRKTHWLMAQGYRLPTIPPVLTWYVTDRNTGKDRELKGRTDDYTLGLYRSKGFVLDRKFLDPQLWHELEYGVKRSVVTVAPPEHSGTTPRLARAIRRAMGERDSWQETPSELFALMGAGNWGMPKSPARLSTEVMKPQVTDALWLHGIGVARRRSNGKRLLQLSRSVGTSGNMAL